MKSLYLIAGWVCLGLGILGIPLPILPTTPFLLLALYCWGKGSPRLQQWFMATSLYRKYLKNYDEKRAMSLKQKITILLISTPFTLFALLTIPTNWGKLAVILLIILQYWYFFRRIKTL